MTPEDETLVRQCVEGDRQAFETLVERYEKTVFNLALRMVNDVDDAHDIAQNVFLKVYEHAASFNKRYKFFSWIYRITVNESINLIQRRKPAHPVGEHVAAPGKSPGEVLRSAELCRAVQRAMMALKPEQRSVVVLRHYLECSYRDIGQILDLPEKTVKSRLFSARQRLRELLVGNGFLGT